MGFAKVVSFLIALLTTNPLAGTVCFVVETKWLTKK